MVAAVGLLEDPSALVLLVGDGPERKALEKEAKRIGVDDRLRFEGFVAHERLPALLAHADLLVLPSLYEELGTVPLEAMQAGLPIVASETGGVPEVIEDGVNGMLVPPGDPEALARAIDRLLADRNLAPTERGSAGTGKGLRLGGARRTYLESLSRRHRRSLGASRLRLKGGEEDRVSRKGDRLRTSVFGRPISRFD